MTNNHNEDLISLKGIAEGDAEALLCVYDLYRDRIYGFVYRMLGVKAAAEDVTHEAFLILIQHPQKYQPERSSIFTYLCMVARSCVLKRYRRRTYEVENIFDERELYSIRDRNEKDPLLSILSQELEDKINESIALLPPLQREVIILRKFQELSYNEISIVTGAEVNVVKARLHRARQTIIKNLAPYLELEKENCHEL